MYRDFRHHHHHHHTFRRMGPIGRFVRAKLRRRIFAWFLGGIVMTGIFTSGVLFLVARINEPEWAHQWEGAQGWFGKQFANTWNDPAARERYARETAKDLGAEVELTDTQGTKVFATEGGCQGQGRGFIAPVISSGAKVGNVAICFVHASPLRWQWMLAAVLFLMAMWKISGGVARRLASPLDELAGVVRRIGKGDLKARVELMHIMHDEIGMVGGAVNDMAARIEKQMVDQRELLATVSHELRTPLARLRIISEIARDTGASPKTFDDLDREIVELDALAGELLANSRLEFGQLVKRELSVRDVGSRAVERAGLAATTLVLSGEGDSALADPTLLQRALANLFDNAKKHAGGADSLEICVSEKEVRFEVLDKGPGIAGDGNALFTKFNRGQDGEGADGLGLGLALVRRIAESHAGTAWAKNREGGGARVGFSIVRT